MTPVNKDKIAKLAQMWQLLPPKHEFWQFLAIAILGNRQKFHVHRCQNEVDINQFVTSKKQ